MGVTAHTHFTLGTSAYKHTLRIRNSYCFSTAMMVALKCLSVGRKFLFVSDWLQGAKV